MYYDELAYEMHLGEKKAILERHILPDKLFSGDEYDCGCEPIRHPNEYSPHLSIQDFSEHPAKDQGPE